MALGEWRFKPFTTAGARGCQWAPALPHPPRVFIEMYNDDLPDTYWIVTRKDPLTGIIITRGRGKTISGPFPDLASAKAAFEILQAFGALDRYTYPP